MGRMATEEKSEKVIFVGGVASGESNWADKVNMFWIWTKIMICSLILPGILIAWLFKEPSYPEGYVPKDYIDVDSETDPGKQERLYLIPRYPDVYELFRQHPQTIGWGTVGILVVAWILGLSGLLISMTLGIGLALAAATLGVFLYGQV